jgi:hypothetical protein
MSNVLVKRVRAIGSCTILRRRQLLARRQPLCPSSDFAANGWTTGLTRRRAEAMPSTDTSNVFDVERSVVEIQVYDGVTSVDTCSLPYVIGCFSCK